MNFARGTHPSPRRHRRTTTESRRRNYRTPATPFLHWKFLKDGSKKRYSTARGGEGSGEVGVSARKLAAGLWQLRSAGGGCKGLNLKCGLFDDLGVEPGVGDVNTKSPSHHISRERGAENAGLLWTPDIISNLKHGMLYKLESSLLNPKHIMEGATKWDPRCPGISNELHCLYNQTKLLENQVATVSVASMMQAELLQARLCIHELEADQQSSNKKVEHLMRKLREERTSWQHREHQKIRAVIENFGKELSKERRSNQKMEILNSKLANELANAKSLAKKVKRDYEEEKRSREIMEQICNELAYKIREDKGEIEVFKTETIKIQEEMEEERKMLQMAEVWREERVQMKLIDAKLALEEKYRQMNKLITDLETFLCSRGATLNVMELRKAELIRQAANLVNVKDIKAFSYVPPKAGDIYSIYEELKQIEANERTSEAGNECSPVSDTYRIQTATSGVDDYRYGCLQKGSNIFIDDNCHSEDDARGYDSVSHAEDQGSSYSHKGSQVSFNRLSQSKNAWKIARECNENAGKNSPNRQHSEFWSLLAEQSEQSMHKASSGSKLSRSGHHNNKCCEITDDRDGRSLNGKISHNETSPRRKSCEGWLEHQDFVGQWSSPDLLNPHVTRGMKGHIEWPRGIQKNSLKAMLLEARMESQKAQLRSVLEQKT